MKFSAHESEIRRIQIGDPFRRVVKLLASPEEGMKVPGYAEPVLGTLRTGRLTVGITEIPPGGGLAPHAHQDTEEIICVLSGTVEYVIDKERVTMGQGAFLHIPPRVRHEAKNSSDGTVRQIWCMG